MTMLRHWVQRHAVVTFYVLVFAVSWGGVLWAIGGFGALLDSGEETEQRLLPVMSIWLAGPSLVGLLLTVLLDGRAGLRDLWARMRRWRVEGRWYAMALLIAPVAYLVVQLTLSLRSPAFLPGLFTTDDLVGLLVFGFGWGLVGGGFLEELGWTGFAAPRLLQRYGVWTTGLIMGVLWGAAHYSVIFWMAGDTVGDVALLPFVAVRGLDLLFGSLAAYRVLMVWVYVQTQESLLVAMLMHASLTASMIILMVPDLAGIPFLVYCVAFSAMLWLVVGVVALATRPSLPAAHGVAP